MSTAPLLDRTSRTALLVAALLAVVTGLLALPAPHADAAAATIRLATDRNLPDPGFSKFGGRYYLYGTGYGFPVVSSTTTVGGYTAPTYSMPRDAEHQPAWADLNAAGDRKLWAPEVFAVSSGGSPLYVMYFTAYDAQKGANCVGTATSRYPDRNFKATTQKICAPQAGYEAIDPTPFLSKAGNRYLLYKSTYRNAAGWKIRAVPMDAATGTVRQGTADRIKVEPGSMMEAPNVVRHGDKVWLFTSRGDWVNCTYSTDVWVADVMWDGTFRRVKTLMSSASTGLCGPGGASFLQDGATTRVAFHAYKSGDPATKIRRPYVAEVGWAADGTPFLR